MTRFAQLMLAVTAAATFAGCGYPETKMEEVGKPQVQTQQGQAPQPVATPAAQPETTTPAQQQEAKQKKVEKTAG